MNLVVNGEDMELAESATVESLILQLGLGTKWVIVERNGEPVNRRDMGTTRLAFGDRIELVRAVAGG